jgi:hypothetical protein
MNGPLLHSKGCGWADYEELGLRKNSTRNSKACKVYGIYTTMEFLLVGGFLQELGATCYCPLQGAQSRPGKSKPEETVSLFV